MRITQARPGVSASLAAKPVAAEPVCEKTEKQLAADEAEAERNMLQCRAAWFSAMAYHPYAEITDFLDDHGLEHHICIADTRLSTVAIAFEFEGRAWLVFTGTDDFNDISRDLQCLPFWHFGFRKCYADIAKDLHQWIEGVVCKGLGFCIAGHSFGGALATLAAEQIARSGKSVEMLCTFGGPRVFAPWQASAFDHASANLAEYPDRTLRDVTYRYVDRFELVSYVPWALAGFRHVGEQIDCEDRPPPSKLAFSQGFGEAGPDDSRWEDLKFAMSKALETPVIGIYVLAVQIWAALGSRGWRAFGAHKMDRYAQRVDSKGRYKIYAGEPKSRLLAGVRITSLLIVIGALVLGLVLVLGFAASLVVLLWKAPWQTIFLMLPLAVLPVYYCYIERRKMRMRKASPLSVFGLGVGLPKPPFDQLKG